MHSYTSPFWKWIEGGMCCSSAEVWQNVVQNGKRRTNKTSRKMRRGPTGIDVRLTLKHLFWTANSDLTWRRGKKNKKSIVEINWKSQTFIKYAYLQKCFLTGLWLFLPFLSFKKAFESFLSVVFLYTFKAANGLLNVSHLQTLLSWECYLTFIPSIKFFYQSNIKHGQILS